MAHLLGIREVIVDLLVHDVENHIQKIPARQGQLRNFTYKIFLQKKAWKVYKKTYHMKKKKPVRIAGYLSKNPSGATFASLLRAPSQAEKAKKKKRISPEADTGESERRKRTSPGGIVSLGRRGSGSEARPENLPLQRRGLEQQRGAELPPPYEVPALAHGADRPSRDERNGGVIPGRWFAVAGEGSEWGGAW